jgi:hypothetical protein
VRKPLGVVIGSGVFFALCSLGVTDTVTPPLRKEKVIQKTKRTVQVPYRIVLKPVKLPSVSGRIFNIPAPEDQVITGTCANVSVSLIKVVTTPATPTEDPNDYEFDKTQETLVKKVNATGSFAAGCDYLLIASYNVHWKVRAEYKGPTVYTPTGKIFAEGGVFILSQGQSLIQDLTLEREQVPR